MAATKLYIKHKDQKPKYKGKVSALPFNKDPILFCQDLLLSDSSSDSFIAQEIEMSNCTIWRWRNDPPIFGRVKTMKAILDYYGWKLKYVRK